MLMTPTSVPTSAAKPPARPREEGEMTWTRAQWAGLGVRFDGEPMSAEEMAYEDDYDEEDTDA
jgi:hypothetical protein